MEELIHAIKVGELLTGVLSSPVKQSGDSLIIKITIRSILIKGTLCYQLTEHVGQKVIHRNLSPNECTRMVQEAIPGRFRQGNFSTKSASYHLLVNRKEHVSVVRKAIQTAAPLPMAHNRKKQYILPEGEPIPFLVSLGIMSPSGQVIAKKYDKFRQINRFVEMVSDVIDHLPLIKGRPLEVIDFGCGKAYLTFALYHYLHIIMGRDVQIVGLDLKQDVIDQCQSLSKALGYDGLSFAVGDIKEHSPKGKVDLVITLHACDTATDAALEKAVSWGADVILSVPCCQHELYNQIKCQSLAPLLRHGILRERFAALATDAARAEMLTYCGYNVQILEFIDMEHTPKNLLLRCVRNADFSKGSPESQRILERYLRYKELLGISPCIDALA